MTAVTSLKALIDLLLTKWIVIPVAMVACWYAYDYGDKYGANAKAYRAVVLELAAKNKELAEQKAEDERAVAAAEKARDDAVKAAGDVKTCKASKATAKKINAVRE